VKLKERAEIPYYNRGIFAELLKVLNVDPKGVHGIEINFPAGNIATLTIKKYCNESDVEELTKFLLANEIKLIEPATDPTEENQ
jgi:hypothetical protein